LCEMCLSAAEVSSAYAINDTTSLMTSRFIFDSMAYQELTGIA
jgi:hypothetical protein